MPDLANKIPVLILLIELIVVAKLFYRFDHFKMAKFTLHGYNRVEIIALSLHFESRQLYPVECEVNDSVSIFGLKACSDAVS